MGTDGNDPNDNAPFLNGFIGSQGAQAGQGDQTGLNGDAGPLGIAEFSEPIYSNRTNYTSPEEFTNQKFFVYEFPSITDPEDDLVKLVFRNQNWFDATFMRVEYNELGFPTRIIFDKSKMPSAAGVMPYDHWINMTLSNSKSSNDYSLVFHFSS